MNESKNERVLLALLRFSSFFCFAGWTWGHWYWEAPYGVLLWQDASFELADRLGISWDEYVGTGENDGWIQRWIARTGWLCLTCAVLSLTVRRRAWFQMTGLIAGGALLTVLSYAKYVSAQRQFPMLIEHGGQMLTPLILVAAIALGARHRVTVLLAMVAVIATFSGHGSYAIGFWPTPAVFFAMTSILLDVQYEAAKTVLHIAGVLDFLVCVGILIPPFRRASVLYATVWGFLTAIARPVAGMSWDLNYWGADQFVHEAVLRAPHFLIPFYLFWLWRDMARQRTDLTQSPTSPVTNKGLE